MSEAAASQGNGTALAKIPKHCPRCRHPKEPDDFPKSATSKTGRLHICRKCFGKSISKGRHGRAQSKKAVKPDEIKLANQALHASNGKKEKIMQAGVGRLLREVVLRLSAQGVELESMRVEKGRMKTTYRIEEEIEL